MKSMVAAVVMGMGLMVAGCATKPTYAGAWKSQSVPEKMEERGISSVTMNLSDSGEYAVTFNDSGGELISDFNGCWEADDSGRIVFHPAEGQGPVGVTAQLLDKSTLEATAGEISILFSRQ